MRPRVLCALLVMLAGCAPLPAPITQGQIRAAFGGESELVLDAAQRCADRLNGLVGVARASGTARTSVSAGGALLGGVGAAMGGVPEADPTVREVGLSLGIAGAALGALSTFIVALTGDPNDLLTRHARGLRSLDAAREAPADVGARERAALLERCVRDEAPARRPSTPPAPSSTRL